MATSSYKTTVTTNGNINKGGSKTIRRYKDGSIISTKTLRGSPGNKNGGANNQYTTNVFTPDRPNSSAPRKSSASNRSQRSSSNSANDSSGDAIGLALIILGAIAAGIAAIGYGIYKLVMFCWNKFTHKDSGVIIEPTKEIDYEPSTQSPTICDGKT